MAPTHSCSTMACDTHTHTHTHTHRETHTQRDTHVRASECLREKLTVPVILPVQLVLFQLTFDPPFKRHFLLRHMDRFRQTGTEFMTLRLERINKRRTVFVEVETPWRDRVSGRGNTDWQFIYAQLKLECQGLKTSACSWIPAHETGKKIPLHEVYKRYHRVSLISPTLRLIPYHYLSKPSKHTSSNSLSPANPWPRYDSHSFPSWFSCLYVIVPFESCSP